jgi:Flp pilus assembly protein TadG
MPLWDFLKRPICRAASVNRSISFLRDQRGAVAFETIIVYVFMVAFLFIPLADVATAGFQYISAWAALRSFGQYVQYNQPTDVTNTSAWVSGLQRTVGNYTISNIQVLCGDTGAGAPCTSANDTLPTKYYSFTTTFTLSPISIWVKSALCPSTCVYVLTSTERFQ